MNTITIDLDDLTIEEQETVKELAEKKKKPYFVPEYGEMYYYSGSDGSICAAINYEDAVDKWNYFTENCFETEKEAEEAITRLQMQTKWKRLSLEAREAENPWSIDGKHYFAYWDCVDKKICNDCHTRWMTGTTHFPSVKSLETAIAKLGEENVKKYILGVEE